MVDTQSIEPRRPSATLPAGDTPPSSIAAVPLHVGDYVAFARDVLAELARPTPGAPPTWRCVTAGTRARVIGWRDARPVLDVQSTERRLVVFAQPASVARLK